MKQNAIVRIILFSLLALVLTGILLGFLFEEIYLLDFDADDGTMLTGEVSIAADSIQKLEINWAVGAVNINTADTDQITFRDSAPENSKYQTVYNVHGNTLELNYSSRGGISIGFGDHSIPGKDLTVTVPQDWVCEQIEIDGASLIISIQHLNAEKIDLDGAANSLQFLGSVEQVDVDGASNNIHLNCENHPTLIDIDGASCDLDIILPSGCGFAVDMEGLSCDFHSDLDYTTKNGQYIYGNGHTNVSVDGISCDVTISESAECAYEWDLGYPTIEPDSGNQLTVYTCLRCGKTKSEAAPNVESDAYENIGSDTYALVQTSHPGLVSYGTSTDCHYGVMADGSVVCLQYDENYDLDVTQWQDTVAFTTYAGRLLGLQPDGTFRVLYAFSEAEGLLPDWSGLLVS